MSENNSTAAATPEEIEARLADLRASVVSDVEELTVRLAPNALKAAARTTAESTVADLRERAESTAAGLKARFSGGTDTPSVSADAPKYDSSSLLARARRLLDDAQDGDPQALALVTGAVAALAGLSAIALIKALRR
ncbi:hypothetical protein [Actinomyces ruminis]|uniref:DUF3618 domain-containing protein n=1 Tax=Actinomyces ruminis TaxID=1937003 RepID=A0ABX4MFZ6_9ACTO|nr:hypothetical protein [Actinomyces ruminis]PHP53077.1 hypothetical protein BW737_004975 [Actinomyces ruminis]